MKKFIFISTAATIFILFLIVSGVFLPVKSYAANTTRTSWGPLCPDISVIIKMSDLNPNHNVLSAWLKQNFPQSNVAQDASNYNWMKLGAMSQSGSGNNLTTHEIVFYAMPSVAQPSDANGRIASMAERYFIISSSDNLYSGCFETGRDSGLNIFGMKAYAAKTKNTDRFPSSTNNPTPTTPISNTEILASGGVLYVRQTTTVNSGYNYQLSEVLRKTESSVAGTDNSGKIPVKIKVTPIIFQDNLSQTKTYIRYGLIFKTLDGNKPAAFFLPYYHCVSVVQTCPGYGVFYDSSVNKTYAWEWSTPLDWVKDTRWGGGGSFIFWSGGSSWVPFPVSELSSPSVNNFVRRKDLNPETDPANFSGAIASTTEVMSENIPIVSYIYGCYDNGGRNSSDVYCYRNGLSMDGRVGSGVWHKYQSGGWINYLGPLGNLLNIFINILTLSKNNLNLGGYDVMMPSLPSLLIGQQGFLLGSYATDVINKYALFSSSKTYNLDFLGTVPDSFAHPTDYFGQYSNSDSNKWAWDGKFREKPTVKLTASSTTAELPDKIGLSWTATNSDSCTASGDWSGVKATSTGSESFIKPKGDYTFGISCSNAIGTATSSARVAVTRVPRCDFSAASLPPPEFSTLKWDCTYTDPDAAKLYNSSADTCLLDGKSVSNIKDSIQKRPSVTTTYNLSCTSDVTKNYSATITIGAPTSTSGGTVKEIKP